MRTLIAILALSFTTAAVAAPHISAQLQPDEIALGQSTRLIVTLTGSGSGPSAAPQLPELDGLTIQPAGQSSQIRIINGQASTHIGFNYSVTPQRAGVFEIPAISAQGAKTDPLKLNVKQSSSTAPQGLGQNQSGAQIEPPAAGDLAFLRIDRADNGDRDHLYVGELTPIAVRAFFREGIQVSQLSKPTLSGGAFTLHNLSDEPKQQTTTIDGKRYRVLTWLAGLSGVKAGVEKLVANVEATIGIPQQGQPRQGPSRQPFGSGFFDDPFSDSAFDSFFQRVEQREITLSNNPTALAVKTLPGKDRPAGFDGAVGQFKLGSFSIPSELETGKPADLKVTVTGKGNFDRVTAPNLLPAGKWKTYKAKDEFEPGDSIGYEASKTFSLPAIVLEPGNFDVAFSFEYFDPESGKYQSINTQPIPVEVTGNALSVAGPVPVEVPAPQREDHLAPLRTDAGRIVSNPLPLYRRPWFIAAQAVPVSAMIAAFGIGMVRRGKEDPARARRRATLDAIDTQLQGLATARQQQDGATFFACARRALQHKLAEHWDCNPEAITNEEIAQKLPAHRDTQRIFDMADAVEFSGASPDPDGYGEWQERLRSALAEIDSPNTGAERLKPKSWGEAPGVLQASS